MEHREAYAGWEATVPLSERRDPVWRIKAYRLARFAGARCWDDVQAIGKRPPGFHPADQLWRAIGDAAAHIAEGYSRSSVLDRIRFLEYALGSAREVIAWYGQAHLVLPDRDMSASIELVGALRNLLLTMIKLQRATLSRRPRFGTPPST